MKPTVLLDVVLSVAAATLAAAAIGSEPPEAKTAEARPAATADAKVAKEKEFEPPPGFARRKRGKYILYCKKDVPMGTRIKTETCYDEIQMRNYMLALQETKGDVDRIRAICSNPCVCGQPQAC